MKEKTERLKGQAAVIFVFALLLLLAFLTLTGIQPHRGYEVLQPVTGAVENIRVRNYHRSLHRLSETRLLVNGTWYKIPGRYAISHLRESGEQVRLLVDGSNVWVLRTSQGTLLSYDTLAKRHQRQRRIDFAILFFLAGIFVLLTILQVKSLKRGDSPFSRKNK